MPQKITLTLRPEAAFEMPISEGYQLYSALLHVMQEGDAEMARYTHDSPIGSISLGPLEGRFCRSDRAMHKAADANERYDLAVGITDPKEVLIFRSIIAPLVLKERNLPLEKGELRVEELKSSTVSFQELLSLAGESKDPCLDIQFKSPTCIQYKNTKVFEMFPHREAVFHSLLSKWNAVCPEELKMAMERDDIARFMIEKPQAYGTHSIVVNTVFDRVKGHARPIMKQGFTGRCRYTFAKNAPEGLRNGIVALARFAEYSGVGSSVARGCGAVAVKVGGSVGGGKTTL
ncbi:MAG: CRISPR system precrRNA processing endoribonuclease RAMP protein Cas6 [Methanothrix sp.]|nr:CRISPR system precrRNA processing endoribonuclease RAMP protein Cas6 [Methanothrix sp.]MDD4446089.1 CRISPR system precrRNA processing endoribonuclease RAMP protein Cas6 [Methanothrix sp.]